jgi:hypothetical protein
MQAAIGPLMRSLGYDPAAIDHSDAQTLLLMHERVPDSLYASVFGLVGPTLALIASLGWHVVLRPAGPLAKLGIRIFQVGLVLVIAQDAIELFADATLPAQFAVADTASREALLSQGEVYDLTIWIVTDVGHTFNFIGALLYGLALLRLSRAWKALAVLALIAAGAMLGGVLLNVAAHPLAVPATFVVVILQIIWSVALAVMMLLWKSREPLPTPA